MTNGQWTCGKGLAGNAALPAKFAEIISAVAENLEVHMGTIDLLDEAGKLEFDAYENLVRAHRDIARRLSAVADEMAGYYTLPMSRHNDAKLASPKVLEAFEQLIALEEDLQALLKKRAEQHHKIQSAMYAG